MKKITVWLKEQKGVYRHNHIENGWNKLRKPEPKSLDQKVWLKQNWLKKSTFITNEGKVL